MRKFGPLILMAWLSLTLWLPVHAKPYDLQSAEGRQVAVVIDDLLRFIQNQNLEGLMALFHPEASALWSNGQRIENLAALTREYQKGFQEISAFEGKWSPLKIDISGENAWLHGNMEWLIKDARTGQSLRLKALNTFILQKRYGRWLIVFEHASHRQVEVLGMSTPIK